LSGQFDFGAGAALKTVPGPSPTRSITPTTRPTIRRAVTGQVNRNRPVWNRRNN
jgi:hypothetical protein